MGRRAPRLFPASASALLRTPHFDPSLSAIEGGGGEGESGTGAAAEGGGGGGGLFTTPNLTPIAPHPQQQQQPGAGTGAGAQQPQQGPGTTAASSHRGPARLLQLQTPHLLSPPPQPNAEEGRGQGQGRGQQHRVSFVDSAVRGGGRGNGGGGSSSVAPRTSARLRGAAAASGAGQQQQQPANGSSMMMAPPPPPSAAASAKRGAAAAAGRGRGAATAATASSAAKGRGAGTAAAAGGGGIGGGGGGRRGAAASVGQPQQPQSQQEEGEGEEGEGFVGVSGVMPLLATLGTAYQFLCQVSGWCGVKRPCRQWGSRLSKLTPHDLPLPLHLTCLRSSGAATRWRCCSGSRPATTTPDGCVACVQAWIYIINDATMYSLRNDPHENDHGRDGQRTTGAAAGGAGLLRDGRLPARPQSPRDHAAGRQQMDTCNTTYHSLSSITPPFPWPAATDGRTTPNRNRWPHTARRGWSSSRRRCGTSSRRSPSASSPKRRVRVSCLTHPHPHQSAHHLPNSHAHHMVRPWSWTGGRRSAGARWGTASPSRRSTRRRSRQVSVHGVMAGMRIE